MKQIYCENPVIIRNSQLKYLLTTYKTYHTPNGDTTITNSIAEYFKYSFPEWKFNPYRFGVTPDNIDDYYIVNKHTGETSPMILNTSVLLLLSYTLLNLAGLASLVNITLMVLLSWNPLALLTVSLVNKVLLPML